MDFALSEEQQEVQKLARQILEDLSTHERLGEIEASAEGIDRTLWQELAKSNLLGVGLPEAFGGSDMGLFTTCVLLEEVGRTVAAAPVIPTLILGALFPLVCRLLADRGHTSAVAVGDVYFANTLGSALGAFSAGFDMKESAARTDTTLDEWRIVLERDFEFIMQFWDHPKPTVAAVHGFCLAGAFELALACDVTVAGEDTRFGEPEVRFGAGIVAMLLPWSVGPKKAKELILTGNDGVSAGEALAMGAVNHVVAPDAVLAQGLRIAKDMSAAAAPAVQASKRAINRTYDIMGMRQALLGALEIDLVVTAAGGPEKDEFNRIRREQGLKAALAWRDAKFR